MTPVLADAEARLQHALDLAWRQLGRRDRTMVEMRRHLEARSVEPATIEAAVAELERQGYLDDARFAARFADDKRRLEHWGRDRIARQLLARGVAPELVDDALGADADGELAAALALLRRRFGGRPDDPRERQRAFGLLVRKGYDPELAQEAIRRHGQGEEVEPQSPAP
jgi:regulatory protein